jgi:hypothetical protein
MTEPTHETAFEQLTGGPQPGLLAELFDFLKQNKKWWLLPILIAMGLCGLLVVLAGSSMAPFIYTLF